MSHIYLEYSFEVDPVEPGREILLAELADLPFESFEETDQGLKGYVRKSEWHEDLIQTVELLRNPEFTVHYHFEEIPPENWNERWETHFEPIEIDDECRVRAPFHSRKEVKYDIVIEPKMSFGTGHHETTHMMLEFLLEMDLEETTVLDMGCGTAVLAILAGMKGAEEIDAIDIDPWSQLNAMENAARNGQEGIRVYQGDAKAIPQKEYDFILANINRNVLLEDLPVYSRHLKTGGYLLLSGFYDADSDLITRRCQEEGLRFETRRERNAWVAVRYKYLGDDKD
ncbi:[LSU ribosomal protein L11P]-lysine N-methyltransferase [Muriicola jejuensis]|uniref:Ribosomal protein L11 methyltransferase n=1 Tax=Muriicola jejuensis TaxID=504488 RepID=A0A6P0UHL6_9FLAO|nr:50S ribosomal protein L11 methyltransferase [Muriicola jejuensis]NER10643.1 50S ribosomal protein L11 methyltransferase [Muriicola jejuensis]SMP17282.1 [LSU ribosomal protein L11P]-lysine N-methyltransferase [Muriicola jejuensis]